MITGLKWRLYWRWRAVGDCRMCGGSGIEAVYGGYGNVREERCDQCAGSGRWRWRDVLVWWWRQR